MGVNGAGLRFVRPPYLNPPRPGRQAAEVANDSGDESIFHDAPAQVVRAMFALRIPAPTGPSTTSASFCGRAKGSS